MSGQSSGKTEKPAGKPGKGKRCPICGAPMRRAYRPFCSRRCADLDLGRWITGAYRIPADEAPDDDAWGEEPREGEPRDGEGGDES
jgi:endogenous inhibitor of DNA gyrase (YacG/DUF329 family)